MFLVLFFVYLFSFLSLHQKHSVPCFWCFFLFIFFLCTPRTRVCVFWWFIYIIFIFAPRDMHYMHVCGGFFFFLFFVLLCTPPTHFDQQTRITNPQTRVPTPQQPVSATYNPNPHVSTIYDSQPRVHWHPRPQNACTSNCMCVSSFVYFFLAFETCVRAVIHVFLMFLFILFYFIPPEMHVRLLVHASLISYLLKMYELLRNYWQAHLNK